MHISAIWILQAWRRACHSARCIASLPKHVYHQPMQEGTPSTQTKKTIQYNITPHIFLWYVLYMLYLWHLFHSPIFLSNIWLHYFLKTWPTREISKWKSLPHFLILRLVSPTTRHGPEGRASPADPGDGIQARLAFVVAGGRAGPPVGCFFFLFGGREGVVGFSFVVWGFGVFMVGLFLVCGSFLGTNIWMCIKYIAICS